VRLVFTTQAWEDYLHWQATDKAKLRRINALIEATVREPFSGIGKPEGLKHALAGVWSRRIDREHRLVYLVDGDDLVIILARFHY
jgi:toxin YoeB